MTDFGFKNNWHGIKPALVEHCEDMHHEKESREIGRSLTEYSCKICDYKYKIDSGD